jgi:hypothetical protein
MLYRQPFFLPLFLVQLSTILLLTLLPSMRDVTPRNEQAVPCDYYPTD